MNQPLENFDEITDIVMDADNTLWDWVSYAVPAYEAMSTHIAKKMGIAEPKVALAMKRFYTAMGTMENVFLIQGLDAMGFFKNHPELNLEELIEEVQKIFTETRRQYLKLYDGTEKTFHGLIKNGKKITILTDAPGIQAPMRLKHFGLYESDPKKMQVYALKAKKPKILPRKFMERKLRGKYDVPFKIGYIDEEKPDTDLFEVLKMTREEIRKHVIIIGDNEKKDMALAKKYGCRGLLAKYGEASTEMLARLLRFAPTRIAKKNVSVENSSDPKPKHDEQDNLIQTINYPEEILKKLNLSA